MIRNNWCIVGKDGRIFPGSAGSASAKAAWKWLVAATEEDARHLKLHYKAVRLVNQRIVP